MTEIGPDLAAFPVRGRSRRGWPGTALCGEGQAHSSRHESDACLECAAHGRCGLADPPEVGNRLPHCAARYATARKLASLVYRLLRWGREHGDEGKAA